MKKAIINSVAITAFTLSTFNINAQDLTPLEAQLNVTIINEKGGANKGDTISFHAKKSGKAYSGVTNEEGKFTIIVPNGDTYEARYKDLNGEVQTTVIEIPGGEPMLINWELTYEMPRVYTLDNVFFDTGKSTLRTESYKELNELLEVMKFKKTMKIEIGGHTDDVGEDAANQKLSKDRANAVRNYLLKEIEPERVTAVGYGESKPIAYNDTPEGRQKNRRTEVRILAR